MELKILSMISDSLRSATKTLSRKSPTILTGVSVAGTVLSIVLTHAATKKAVRTMDKIKSDEDYEPPDSKAEEVIEEVRNTWQHYIPVVIIATVTIASEIQSNRISIRRIAMLSDAYRLSENLRHEYEEKVKQVVGEKKAGEIDEAIASDRVNESFAAGAIDEGCIEKTGKGNALCKDWHTGRLFYSDPEFIRQVRNRLDSKLLSEDYISLYDYYYELKLDAPPNAHDYGWNIDQCDRRDLTDIQIIPVTTKSGLPCLMIKYDVYLNYDMFEPS